MNHLFPFLNLIAYHYYPKKIHESDEKYSVSHENQKFMQLYSNYNSMVSSIQTTIDEFRRKFVDYQIVLDNSTSHMPVYEIEFFLGKDIKVRNYLTIYISFMVPYFHIAYLQLNQENGQIKKQQKAIPDLENKIDQILTTNLAYGRFPDSIIDQTIPELIITEDFTYLNAFFTDYYRITHVN